MSCTAHPSVRRYSQEGDGVEEVEEEPTMAAFKRAAAELAERRKEEQMTIEDRIAKYMHKWCQDWEKDLDMRTEDIKESAAGARLSVGLHGTPCCSWGQRRLLVEQEVCDACVPFISPGRVFA